MNDFKVFCFKNMFVFYVAGDSRPLAHHAYILGARLSDGRSHVHHADVRGPAQVSTVRIFSNQKTPKQTQILEEWCELNCGEYIIMVYYMAVWNQTFWLVESTGQ